MTVAWKKQRAWIRLFCENDAVKNMRLLNQMQHVQCFLSHLDVRVFQYVSVYTIYIYMIIYIYMKCNIQILR